MSLSFFATCPKGLESLLLNELNELGAVSAKETVAGVSFKGDFALGMKACLWSRFASRILLELSEFYCVDDSELYLGAYGVAWEKYFDKDCTIAVTFSGTNEHIRNTQYGAMKVKDAVCDRMAKTLGGRPDVDKDNPDVVINCHLDKKDSANILIDISGKALLKREYHRGTGAAPLKENLAAAMIYRSGYNHENFLDPIIALKNYLTNEQLDTTNGFLDLRKYAGDLGYVVGSLLIVAESINSANSKEELKRSLGIISNNYKTIFETKKNNSKLELQR